MKSIVSIWKSSATRGIFIENVMKEFTVAVTEKNELSSHGESKLTARFQTFL